MDMEEIDPPKPLRLALGDESLAESRLQSIENDMSVMFHRSDNWISPDGLMEVPIRVENRVYTCRINQKLNLNYVARIFPDANYNRMRFAAVIRRFWKPKIAVLIFALGKFVCTGAKEYIQARHMIYSTINELREKGYWDVKLDSISINGGLQIQNMVAAAAPSWTVNLTALHESLSAYCTFVPELFPGVIFRHSDVLGSMTILIFRTGKMVFTGAKSRFDIIYAMDTVYPMLLPFIYFDRRMVPLLSTQTKYMRPIQEVNADVRINLKRKHEILAVKREETDAKRPHLSLKRERDSESAIEAVKKPRLLVPIKSEPTQPPDPDHPSSIFDRLMPYKK